MVQIWFEFPDPQIKVPYSQELGRFGDPIAVIDNDGSAEILYVSNYGQGAQGATITALRDKEERWIQARRIWNQYSYHVTNVREDGTIPAQMKNNWELLNTFRTNSQIEKGGVCDPQPQ